jgi:hypothetical protein
VLHFYELLIKSLYIYNTLNNFNRNRYYRQTPEIMPTSLTLKKKSVESSVVVENSEDEKQIFKDSETIESDEQKYKIVSNRMFLRLRRPKKSKGSKKKSGSTKKSDTTSKEEIEENHFQNEGEETIEVNSEDTEVISIPIDYHRTKIYVRKENRVYDYRTGYMKSLQMEYSDQHPGMRESLIDRRLEYTEERSDPFYCVLKYPSTTLGITLYDLLQFVRWGIFSQMTNDEILRIILSRYPRIVHHPSWAIFPRTQINRYHKSGGYISAKITPVIPLVALPKLLESMPKYIIDANDPFTVCTDILKIMEETIQHESDMFASYYNQLKLNVSSMYKEKNTESVSKPTNLDASIDNRFENQSAIIQKLEKNQLILPEVVQELHNLRSEMDIMMDIMVSIAREDDKVASILSSVCRRIDAYPKEGTYSDDGFSGRKRQIDSGGAKEQEEDVQTDRRKRSKTSSRNTK